MKFETRTLYLSAESPEILIAAMNKLGEEGWEPFHMDDRISGRGGERCRVWFKRQL